MSLHMSGLTSEALWWCFLGVMIPMVIIAAGFILIFRIGTHAEKSETECGGAGGVSWRREKE